MPKVALTICFPAAAEAKPLLLAHHYLSAKSRGFRSGFNVGLKDGDKLIGCAIFTNFPVPEVAVGLYGLARDDQFGLYELSRFCISPDYQATEHNLGTWFLARAINQLKYLNPVRALLSYADTELHVGTLYQAYGFKYYGLTALKKDWKPVDSALPLSRGCTDAGEWVPRTQKHRYLITYDKKLKPLWNEQPYPKKVTI